MKYYRADIDGLRAISIIAVLIYHLQFFYNDYLFLKGGFIGVDIFFVISGYLIGSIIFREYKEKSKLNIKNFYERRIRRIIPTLLIVLIFTSIAGWFLLLPTNNFSISLYDLSFQQNYSLSFISNFYFWTLSQRYGEPDSFLNPLLHTWSLSIEEQFYIVFPLVCLFLFKFMKKKISIILISFFFISLIANHIFSLKYISFVFYMLPFRAWEIISGIYIAYRHTFYKRNINDDNLSSFLIFLGLCLIIFSFFFYSDQSNRIFGQSFVHPSIYSVLPIIGTCLIIFYGNKNKTIIKFLSNKFFVFIGLISYSLYLWHYPIIVFSKIMFDFNNPLVKLSIIFISLFLSILSYFFIETKLRNKKIISFKKFNYIILPTIFGIIIFNYLSIQSNGYKHRLKLSDLQKEQILNKKINFNYLSPNNNKKKNILIVGNSHAKDFYRAISKNIDLSSKYNFMLMHTQIDCFESSIKMNRNTCARTIERHKSKFNYYKAFKESEIVILKTRWMIRDLNSIETTIEYLLKNKKKTILISSNPEFKTKNAFALKINEKENLSLLKKIYYKKLPIIDKFFLTYDKSPNEFEKKIIDESYYENLKIDNLNNNILSKIIDKKYINSNNSYNKIYYINIENDFCDHVLKTCKSTFNNSKIFNDNAGHLTENGIDFFNKNIINSKLKKIINEL